MSPSRATELEANRKRRRGKEVRGSRSLPIGRGETERGSELEKILSWKKFWVYSVNRNFCPNILNNSFMHWISYKKFSHKIIPRITFPERKWSENHTDRLEPL